jgi:recombinational DNA repair ATPase RecF
MRIRELRITEFRGVEVKLLLGSAVILFGPNDSGKSNVLDAVEIAFKGLPSVASTDCTIQIRIPRTWSRRCTWTALQSREATTNGSSSSGADHS